MKRQIERVSLHQSSLVIALVYFVLLAIYALFFTAIGLAAGDYRFLLLLVYPFLGGGLTYLLHLIIFWIYNLIAESFGGIEFTLSEKKAETSTDISAE